jgi:hypothetical protein
VLLEAGANPTDGVTTHIAGGGGNLDALELLHRYGVNVNGIPGGVPPLVYMMSWADTPAGPYWLLDHGADANLAWGEAGEAPLHGGPPWDMPMVERLVEHDADVLRPRRRLTPPPGRASWQRGDRRRLLARRARRVVHRTFYRCMCARDALAATPITRTRSELRPEHHQMLHRPAEARAAVLDTMSHAGSIQAKDKDNVTPLHRAAMGGHVDAVRVLLKHGADVNARDGMFSASPLVWAVEGRRNAKHRGADHVGVARLLIAAGVPLEWTAPEGAPDIESTQDALMQLPRRRVKEKGKAEGKGWRAGQLSRACRHRQP